MENIILRDSLELPPCAETTLNIRKFRTIPFGSPTSIDIDGIDRIGNDVGGLDLNPVYQRDHVWDIEHRKAFLGYLLIGGYCPTIWVNRYEGPKTGGKDWLDRSCSIIDGKQRITSLIMWVRGEIPAVVPVGGSVTTPTEIWYKDLSGADRRMLPWIPVQYCNLTEKEQMALYLSLNGGVAHSPDELNRVRELLSE